MKKTLTKHSITKPGDDLWQWAARADAAAISTPAPVLTSTERGILVRLWASLRGILKTSAPVRTRSRRVSAPRSEQELLP